MYSIVLATLCSTITNCLLLLFNVRYLQRDNVSREETPEQRTVKEQDMVCQWRAEKEEGGAQDWNEPGIKFTM